MVIVVLAMTTLGRLSVSGTYGRMNQAFTASPPTDAVGVVMLNASPARRAASSDPNGTPAASGRLIECRENDDVLSAFCPLHHSRLVAENRANDGGQVVLMPVTVHIGHILGGRRSDL